MPLLSMLCKCIHHWITIEYHGICIQFSKEMIERLSWTDEIVILMLQTIQIHLAKHGTTKEMFGTAELNAHGLA